jgi:hypothetical protein
MGKKNKKPKEWKEREGTKKGKKNKNHLEK